MSRLRNLSLNLRLNLLLLMVIGFFLIGTMALLLFNTAQLMQEIASERISQEVSITQEHLAEIQKALMVDVNFTASSVPFVQAVGRRSAETVGDLISSANQSLEMDDIDVFDGDGKHLTGLDTSASPDKSAVQDTELSTALKGTPSVGVRVYEFEGKTYLSISSTAPVASLRQGTVLGAIQMSRQINDTFLSKLAFQRDGVFLGLIYGDKIQARNVKDKTAGDSILYEGIAFDAESVRTAFSGQTVISKEPITSGNVPYTVAYVPLVNSKNETLASMMILVDLKEIYTYQTTVVRNTITVFAILALLALIVTYLSLKGIVIQPLTELKTIAQKMTSGQYDQRIPIQGQDEVGQLATTFNEMAEAVQQRETNLQQARAQAERSDQVKSAFLASMSHELRTPLNAVINFTQFLIDGDAGPTTAEQNDLLGEVVGSAKHLLDLINDVLDMSKIEAGSLKLFVEDNINLNNILNRVASTGRSLLRDKASVQLRLETDGLLPRIRGDQQRIFQILLNILSNACKFTEKGDIAVAAKLANDEVILSISDTGPGIAPEDQGVVFEPFKQTNTGLRQGGGTGLGMPIAKNLAEAHGGRLWLESIPGKGTTFFVALPIKSESLVPVV